MVKVFADNWREGMRLDLDEVFDRRDMERAAMADLLRQFKALIKSYLPFPNEPSETMLDTSGQVVRRCSAGQE
jgi:hypothetical protein